MRNEDPESIAATLRGTPHDVYPMMSHEELRAGVLEGSGRALAEWQRRGEFMPIVEAEPAWLP